MLEGPPLLQCAPPPVFVCFSQTRCCLAVYSARLLALLQLNLHQRGTADRRGERKKQCCKQSNGSRAAGVAGGARRCQAARRAPARLCQPLVPSAAVAVAVAASLLLPRLLPEELVQLGELAGRRGGGGGQAAAVRVARAPPWLNWLNAPAGGRQAAARSSSCVPMPPPRPVSRPRPSQRAPPCGGAGTRGSRRGSPCRPWDPPPCSCTR